MKIRYSEIAHKINVEAFEEALGFEPKYVKNDEAVGYCFDPWAQHKNGDTTGKLAINREKRVYNCWVCGGGSLLDLTMAVKDLCEEDALDWLVQFVEGVESNDTFLSDVDRILAQAKSEQKALPYFNDNVLRKWTDGASSTEKNSLAEYLRRRGISDAVAERNRVGYNSRNIRKSSKGDFEGPAIIFPHFWRGRLVGWQSRWDCDTPKYIPKYINTHDFPREYSIYNYEAVYFAEKPIVVVESVPTALFLQTLGWPAVATFGGTVTDEQIRLLRSCQQGIIIAGDNDAVGDKNEGKLIRGLERFVKVRVCERAPGEGEDLGDLCEHPNIVLGMLREASYLGAI